MSIYGEDAGMDLDRDDYLRDAYRNGLAIAIPTGPNELGWAMAGKDERHPALEGAL